MSAGEKGKLIHYRLSTADAATCRQIAVELRQLYPNTLVKMLHRQVKADRVVIPVCIITVRERV